MKIALAQLNFHIGNFDLNKSKIIDNIEKAKKENADLIVFPELAICGYPPRDFLEFDDFIEKCHQSLNIIAEKSINIAVIIGCPSVNNTGKGKKLFNSAFFINNGKIENIINKSLLPNYDIFDEYRYFEPNTNFEVLYFKNKKIALTICEDIWNIGSDLLYRAIPMDELKKQNPDFIINIAASPFNYSQAEKRKEILRLNSHKYDLPIIYVNHIGAQTELLFDGGSMFLDKSGNIIKELNYFEEDFCIIDTEIVNTDKQKEQSDVKIKKIHDALVMGIKDYFSKMGFKKAILGLSGGIDSAVTLALAVKALGKENVLSVMLPTRFSSNHSVDDSLKLLENLDSKSHLISIEKSFNVIEETLKPYFDNIPFNLAEENMQARIRAVILMALSNKHGYILLNTSNKSEAAVGYGTLYGDMCGGLSVLGDVYKTDVYELANYINKNSEIIPKNIITKAPSAELRPNQKDSDSLPEYDILDKILYNYIELEKGPSELITMGFDKNDVNLAIKLVNTNEYKRYQSPPILRISPKAFGMGRRMPIVAKYLS